MASCNSKRKKNTQMKYSDLKKQKHFESHFNLDHTKLKMLEKIVYTQIYIRSLHNLSLKVNNNEPSDENFKKDIQKNEE